MEEREFKLRITAITAEAEKGFSDTQRSIISLNQGLDLFSKGISIAKTAFSSFAAVIERGQQFTELNNSFNAITKSVGVLSSEYLPKLQTATTGIISNMDLMRASNQALQSGLTPEQFLKLASAADALGDTIGESTVNELNKLITAASTGNERLLKQEGILINNKKAEEDFAKSIGRTGETLNEDGKRLANREAIIAAVTERQKLLGSASETAGDKLQKLSAAFENGVSYILDYINKSENLILVLDGISNAATTAANGIRYLFSDDQTAKLARQLDELTAAKSNLATIQQYGQFANQEKLAAAQAEVNKLTEAWNKSLEEAKTTIPKVKTEIDKNTSSLIDLTEKNKKATDEMEKLTEEAKKQAFAFSQLQEKQNLDGLLKSIEKAKDSLNGADFQNYLNEYQTKLTDTLVKSELDKNKEAIKQGKITEDEIIAYSKQESAIASQEIADDYRIKQEEAFQNSFDTFVDLLSSADQYADFEDTIKDVLKRVAIGFAAQMAASVAAQQFGLNIGNISSATGVGQSLASSFGFGGGGVSGASSLFSASSSLYNGTNSLFGTVAAGPPTASGALPIAAGTTNFGSYVLPGIGIAAGAYGLSQSLGNGKQDIFSGAASGAAVGAGVGTLILPGIGTAIGAGVGALGGGLAEFFDAETKKAKERKAREEALNKIFGDNLSFSGAGGRKTLSSSAFNLDTSGFGGDAAALNAPLASILSGGDGKLKDDLTAIFANATKEGKNFNEVLVSSQALLQKTGYSAEQAKDAFGELFLDGKIGLDEFSQGIEKLNLLGKNDLVGKGSVSDALGIVTDKLNEPRVKLRGLALAFNEMKEIGVDSFSEIHNYLSNTATPEIVAAFDQLVQAGFDTFEEIANASEDQIITIFKIIKDISPLIINEYESIGESLATSTEDGTKKAEENLRKLRETSAREGALIRGNLNINARVNVTSTGDVNPSLNKKAA